MHLHDTGKYTPHESRDRILAHLRKILPQATEEQLASFIA